MWRGGWVALFITIWLFLSFKMNSEAPDQLYINYLSGRFNPESFTDFIRVDPQWTNKDYPIFLRKSCYQAFLSMALAAKKDGVPLVIVSATRNFDYQKKLWERKWRKWVGHPDYADQVKCALKVMEYTAMPGTSRHHWGTDIDLNAVNNRYFTSSQGLSIYEWLKENAHKYGFCQTYCAFGDHRRHGYQEEKWHWSYMPLSGEVLEKYEKYFQPEWLTGFSGDETSELIPVLEQYILSINEDCNGVN